MTWRYKNGALGDYQLELPLQGKHSPHHSWYDHFFVQLAIHYHHHQWIQCPQCQAKPHQWKLMASQEIDPNILALHGGLWSEFFRHEKNRHCIPLVQHVVRACQRKHLVVGELNLVLHYQMPVVAGRGFQVLDHRVSWMSVMKTSLSTLHILKSKHKSANTIKTCKWRVWKN